MTTSQCSEAFVSPTAAIHPISRICKGFVSSVCIIHQLLFTDIRGGTSSLSSFLLSHLVSPLKNTGCGNCYTSSTPTPTHIHKHNTSLMCCKSTQFKNYSVESDLGWDPLIRDTKLCCQTHWLIMNLKNCLKNKCSSQTEIMLG